MSKVEKKVFDSATAKKIIADYADKLNYYMKDNQNYKNQIEDLKMTLKINKDLLFKYISTNVQQTEQIGFLNDYKEENIKLQEKNEKLHQDKVNLEKKIYKFQQDFQDEAMRYQEKLDKLQEEIFQLRNKIDEKDTSINLIKNTQDKSLNLIKDKSSLKEIFITEPTKVNVELNNELTYTREVISKVTKMLNQEKLKSDRLESKYNTISDELEKFKKIGKNKEDYNSNTSAITPINRMNDKNGSISSFTSDSDLDLSLESNSVDSVDVKIPNKGDYSNSYISNSKPTSPVMLKTRKNSIGVVPKLDFKIIQSKYMSEGMKPNTDLKKSQSISNFKLNDENSKQITSLQNELKDAKKTIKDLNGKIENYRLAYNELKEKFRKTKESLIYYKSRVESSESTNKKYCMPPSTDDMSNKRVIQNTSMVLNII